MGAMVVVFKAVVVTGASVVGALVVVFKVVIVIRVVVGYSVIKTKFLFSLPQKA